MYASTLSKWHLQQMQVQKKIIHWATKIIQETIIQETIMQETSEFK